MLVTRNFYRSTKFLRSSIEILNLIICKKKKEKKSDKFNLV